MAPRQGAALLLLLWVTLAAAEPEVVGECVPHRELLLVRCVGVTAATLPARLRDSQDGTAHPWVQEVQILDGRLPVLTSVVPPNVSSLGQVEVLEVARCQVRQVQVEALMAVSGSLRYLSLAYNKLVAVPAAVAVLERLEVLDLRQNAITRLSPLLAKLPRLRHLKLDHNRLRQLSGWSSAHQAQVLPSLTHLTLSDNFIHEVWVEALSGVPALQRLDLSHNLLQRLPRALRLPRNLMELDLRGNPWHCDCESVWLSELQYQTQYGSMLAFLPQCGSPEYLNKQELEALTAMELCSGLSSPSAVRPSTTDLADHQMKLTKVEARSFQLSWNVSNISQRGKKVQEYLGWRVTFRKFVEDKESEVLLITLAGEEANRKTGTSSGHYTVQHLTPNTAYLVCIQTLSDAEVNNIIDSQSGARDDKVTDQPQPLADEPLPEPRELDVKQDDITEHPLANIFREELKTFWEDRLKELSTKIPITENTTIPPQNTKTTLGTENPTTSGNNFVYTNTGERISVNFGPPGVPVNSHSNSNSDITVIPPFTLSADAPYSLDDGFIRNIPPPPPPIHFGSSPSSLRVKRSLGIKTAVPGKGKCLELRTDEEDEITMPVTVAATASSSTTMVILMICCCCFPKKCNRIRDSCIDKCSSIGNKTIVKTNSKTKTFVKPAKNVEKHQLRKLISASTPDLRLLQNEREKSLQYITLNKYYTMKKDKSDSTRIQFYPGYDIPKSATAKYFGYDFPRTTLYDNTTLPRYTHSVRKMSTDDNVSPVENDRFIYNNLNKIRPDADKTADQCKYSNMIKGLNYAHPHGQKICLYEYQKTDLSTSPKISNYEYCKLKFKKSPLSRVRSLSEPDLTKINRYNRTQPILRNNCNNKDISLFNVFTTQTNPAYVASPGNINYGKLRPRTICKSYDARLEIVKHIDQPRKQRPTILNIDQQKWVPNNNNNLMRITANPNALPIQPRGISCSPPKEPARQPHKTQITPTGEVAVTGGILMEVPEGYVYPARTIPCQNGSFHPSPQRSTSVGDVVITGGTLMEVPEGYVFPAKPRSINVLRLKVPADIGTVSEA